MTHTSPHYDVTLYPSLTDTYSHQHTCLSLVGLVDLFSHHTPLPPTSKLLAPSFGPYKLHTPDDTCPPTKHPDRRAHRCDGCVRSVSLAVFDVDEGTAEDVRRCRERLRGVAQIWYSSFRHTDADPRYRLVLPLPTPVLASAWRGVRAALLHRYSIPAAEVTSSGVSHLYFLPSCPVGATGVTLVVDGDLVPVPTARAIPREVVRVGTYEPPDEPTEPVDLEPYRARLRGYVSRMKRDPDRKAQWKAGVLGRLLDGRALEEHGHRNVAASTAAGVLAYSTWGLPGYSLGTLYSLLAPSVEAMMAAGSSITEAEVERMLLSAMRSKWEAEERDAGIRRALLRAGTRTSARVDNRNR